MSMPMYAPALEHIYDDIKVGFKIFLILFYFGNILICALTNSENYFQNSKLNKKNKLGLRLSPTPELYFDFTLL